MAPKRVTRKAFLLASIIFQVLLLTVRTLLGCGLQWNLPTNHFDGIDPYGHISYWEHIGEVDCGDGLVLPLNINFNSAKDMGNPSPYIGQGWMLPLLESKIVQESENSFRMLQPDGLNNPLERANTEEKVLDGSADWKGEINGDTITAWATCGWKLVFFKGRIISMTTPTGRQLNWIYEGAKVSELCEGSIVRLKVEYASTGQATALTLAGNKRLVLTQEKKPHVQTIDGRNVITGIDKSLSGLILAGGQVRSYEFGTDDKMLPTLRVDIGGERANRVARQMSWNPQTKFAVRDDEWTYQVTPASKIGETAMINRSNFLGQTEFWQRDDTEGIETSQDSNGVKQVKTWFVNGVLAGALRKIEVIKEGKSVVTRRIDYDAQGNIIREEDHGRLLVRAPNGAVLSIDPSSKIPYNTMHTDSDVAPVSRGLPQSLNDLVLYERALASIDRGENIDKITDICNHISDEDLRTTAFLNAVASDDAISTEEKILKLQSRMPAFGRQATRARRLIRYYEDVLN